MLIEWSDNLCVGLGELDAQHREMADLLNRLEGATSAPLRAEALAILDALYAHTRLHFAFEERLMGEIAYAGTVEHRREHLMLLAELKSFISGVRRGGERLDAGALGALKKWLVGHIIANDRAFVHRLLEVRGAP